MDEIDIVERDRIGLVEQLVTGSYAELVQHIIHDIRSLPEDCRASGDDSKLQDA